MADEHLPETEPRGALVPPPARPPTAVAAAAPLPPPPRRTQRTTELRSAFRRLVEATLDELDALGDRIAGAIGGRGR